MKISKMFLWLVLGLTLVLAPEPAIPARALTKTNIVSGAVDSNPNLLDLKQAVDDFAANVGQPISAAEIVSFLTDQARPALLADPFGPSAVFNPAATFNNIAAVKLTNTKFVVVYTDNGNSGYGTAIIGQVSDATITWGNEYVFNPAETRYESVVALSDAKFVVAYADVGNSYYGTAIVGQVSGTTITYGSETVFNPSGSAHESVAALSDTSFVVAYMDNGNSGYGAAIVGQVSGATISYGSETVFNPASTECESVTALSDTKFVVAYTDGGNSWYGTARVGQVSGATITYGSETVFNPASTYGKSVVALSDTRFVVAYRDDGNSGYGTAIVGQVSGATISYGSEFVFNPANTSLYHSRGVFRLSDTAFVVGYENLDNSDGRTVVGTVPPGSTGIVFGNQVSYNAGSNSYDVTVVALSESQYIVAWDDESNSDYGTAKVGVIPTFGPATVFNSSATWEHIAATKLTDSKFVVAYTDMGNSYYGTAIVGQVSGATITWGSEYIFNPAGTRYESVAALSNTKFVVGYIDDDNSYHGTAIVGQVSGTTITWGNEYVFNPGETDYADVAALSDTKFVVVYQDGDNSSYGTAIVGQVSGTTISYGAEAVFNPASTMYESVAALTDAKFVAVYTDSGNSFYGTAIVGQVSGATISYGAEAVFNPAGTFYTSVAALTNAKFVAAYRDEGSSGYGAATMGQVSGATITYGAEALFNPADTILSLVGGVVRLSDTAFVVGYKNTSNSEGRTIMGAISGGSAITFGHQVSVSDTFEDADGVTVAPLSESKFIVAWRNQTVADDGTAKVGMLSNATTEVYLPVILRN